jgi:hypothetical protein
MLASRNCITANTPATRHQPSVLLNFLRHRGCGVSEVRLRAAAAAATVPEQQQHSTSAPQQPYQAAAGAAAHVQPELSVAQPASARQQHHQQQLRQHQQQQQQQGQQLPKHVAIIMDGNSRWAESRGLPAWVGHERGVAALRAAVIAAREWGIPALTVRGQACSWQEARMHEAQCIRGQRVKDFCRPTHAC